LLKVEGSLGEVGGAAKVAPVVFVGTKGEDFVALGGESDVRVNDGKDSGFGEEGEDARREDVDAGKSERVGRQGFLGRIVHR